MRHGPLDYRYRGLRAIDRVANGQLLAIGHGLGDNVASTT